MASTYSNLKIQLMATGENSGTWGNVTNTNLGTALEQAITGSVDVTVNTDVTLSLTDSNAAQDARALRLNLTGSGAANLTVPAIQKLYLINNATLGTVTVKNATGATIAVPTTKTMWVFSTGTGVVDAVTHLSSLTLGSALPIASGGTGSTSTTFANLQSNVTGTLPIANGGTGSTSTTYANLQSNVSGTLPIANGGTGTTSTTFANLQSNVSGTLPIANGGTGSTSTTYANLQSNVSGTLPVANGGTGQTALTANNVVLGNGTSGVQFVAPGTNGNVLTSNGSTWQSTAPSGGGQLQQSLALRTSAVNSSGTPLVYNSAGSLTWTCPTGVTRVKVTCIAGGGAGGGTDPDGNMGGSGGGGGFAIGVYTVSPGTAYAVTVGVGGTGNAGSGGSSSFSSLISATGGAGGSPASGGGGTAGNNGAGSSGNLRNSVTSTPSRYTWASVGDFYGPTAVPNGSGTPVVWGASTIYAPGAGGTGGGSNPGGGGTSGLVLIEYVGS